MRGPEVLWTVASALLLGAVCAFATLGPGVLVGVPAVLLWRGTRAVAAPWWRWTLWAGILPAAAAWSVGQTQELFLPFACFFWAALFASGLRRHPRRRAAVCVGALLAPALVVAGVLLPLSARDRFLRGRVEPFVVENVTLKELCERMDPAFGDAIHSSDEKARVTFSVSAATTRSALMARMERELGVEVFCGGCATGATLFDPSQPMTVLVVPRAPEASPK